MANDKTAEILETMLKENTGKHFMDSGDAYGRHWQRNATRQFENEPASTLKFSIYKNRDGEQMLEIEFSHSLFHWLNNICTFEEELDELFHTAYLEEADPNNDKCWLELMTAFPKWLEQSELEDEFGNLLYENISGYGGGDPFTDYSYNNECLLDQDIQYTYFTMGAGHDEYVILQTHNGCDARGGLSKCRIFSLNDELGITNYARGTICCSGKNYHPTALAIKEQQDKQTSIADIQTVGRTFSSRPSTANPAVPPGFGLLRQAGGAGYPGAFGEDENCGYNSFTASHTKPDTRPT